MLATGLLNCANPVSTGDDSRSRPMDFEEALHLAGGTGRAQYSISVAMVLSFVVKSMMVYGLTYLEKLPKYECLQDGEWVQCHTVIICTKVLVYKDEWRIDYTSEESFRNWVAPEQLDLTCVSTEIVALVGSFFFAGFCISAGITAPLADKVGRKWIHFFSLSVMFVAYFLVVFVSRSIYVTMGCYFVAGLCSGGTEVVSAAWMNEFLPHDAQKIATTLLLAFDSSIMIFQTIYYSFSRNWLPLHIFGVFVTGVLLIVDLMIPESPKYLYATKRFNDARHALMLVARFNRVQHADKLSQINFDTEVFDFEKTKRDDEMYPQFMPTSKEVIFLSGQLSEICFVWQIRRNTVVLAVLFSVGSFCFFSMNFLMGYMQGSIIVNTYASQLSEILGTILSAVIYTKLGARLGFSVSYLFSTIGCGFLITVLNLNFQEWSLPMCIFFSKFGVAAAFSMTYIANIQLVPTLFCASILGSCNVLGRMVTMLAPEVAAAEGNMPLILFFICTVFAACTALFLLEDLPHFI